MKNHSLGYYLNLITLHPLRTLYNIKLLLYDFGHSGQQTSVNCAEATWFTRSKGTIQILIFIIINLH